MTLKSTISFGQKEINMLWIIMWAVVLFLLGWEMLALLTKEKIIPTWSRLIWQLQTKYPEARKIVLGITLVVMLGTTVWLVLHFWYG